jgi:hypothetical protein
MGKILTIGFVIALQLAFNVWSMPVMYQYGKVRVQLWGYAAVASETKPEVAQAAPQAPQVVAQALPMALPLSQLCGGTPQEQAICSTIERARTP